MAVTRNIKVCEACGGLFVRATGSSSPYCRHCTPRMAEAPQQRGRLRTVMAVEETVERVECTRRNRPDARSYRDCTGWMLRRFGVLSMQAGKAPSIDMQAMYRGKVSHCRVVRFDDVVNFVHDMESCLRELPPGQQRMLYRIGVQEYTQGEAARMFGMSLRSVVRRYYAAMDALTMRLLERGMLAAC